MEPLALDTYGTVSLAGGGNRCWWQAGVLEVFLDSGRWQAQRMSGTTAGAGVAAAALCGALAVAVEHCQCAYAENVSMWRGRRGAWFAQEDIYPRWVRSYLSSQGLAQLRRSGTQLWVGVPGCRPPCPPGPVWPWAPWPTSSTSTGCRIPTLGCRAGADCAWNCTRCMNCNVPMPRRTCW